MTTEVKVFKLYDQTVLVPMDSYVPGIENFDFKVFSGSRILTTLLVKTIDPGATVTVEVLNSFSIDGIENWDSVLTFTADAVGHTKKIITDFNRFFRYKITVVGGEVEYSIALNIFDNSSDKKINDLLQELVDGIEIAELIPKNFNKFQVIARNLDGDPIQIEYFKDSVSIGILTLTYNLDGDINSGEFNE